MQKYMHLNGQSKNQIVNNTSHNYEGNKDNSFCSYHLKI